MRRIMISLTTMAIALAMAAAPAAARRDDPGKPQPSVAFEDESVACEFQPERGVSVVTMSLRIDRAPGGEKSLVLEASRASTMEDLGSAQMALAPNSKIVATLGYEFASDTESTFEVTHVATLYNRKGQAVATAEAVHELVCVEWVPEPEQ